MKTLLCHLKYILFSRYKKYVIQTESLAQPFDMLLCHLKYILFSSYKKYVIQIESPAQPFDMKIWGSIARDGLRFFLCPILLTRQLTSFLRNDVFSSG